VSIAGVSREPTSTTVRKVIFVAIGLLMSSIEALQAGERQYQLELQRIEASFYISDFSPGMNSWQAIGLFLLLASLSFAIAAFMLWRHDH
jgi:hypothetical protein